MNRHSNNGKKSRIGKLPILIPEGVTVHMDERILFVSGPLGDLSRYIHSQIIIIIEEDKLFVETINSSTNTARALHGLFRTLVDNMISGVTEKFEVELELRGVGYRCALVNDSIVLNLGRSHKTTIQIPKGIEIIIDTPTKIKVLGINNEKVGFFAAQIRSHQPPEPYNGKGIVYSYEDIPYKPGKSGK